MSGTIAGDRRGWTGQGRDRTGPGYKPFFLNASRKLQIQKSMQWLRKRAGSDWCNVRAKAINGKLTLVIFADGRVQLESPRERLNAGCLDGQQWCTHQFAVLRITNEKSVRRLLILSARQQETGHFRRLQMWLRQGLCDNTSASRRVSGRSV
ncbi:MAG: hypothetical protein WBS20_10540 [Lysobacterales bacterium]